MDFNKTDIPEFDLLKTPLSGTNLIEANAGTGKTYAISKLFLRLLLEEKARVDEILVVTFTEAATQELKERIREDLIAARDAFLSGHSEELFFQDIIVGFNAESSANLLRNALRLFDDVAIFTIHGFCQRSLKDNTFESGSLFEMELITDQRELLEEVIDDFWRNNLYTASPTVAEFLLRRIKSTEYFLSLSRKIPLTEEINLLPPKQDIPPRRIEQEQEGFSTLLAEIRELWEREKANIGELLTGTSLKGNIYGSKAEKFLTVMDAFLHHEKPDFNLPKEFTYFTTEKLESSLKKDFSLPSHPFFPLCDALTIKAERLEQLFDGVLLNLEHDLFFTVKRELVERKQKRNLLYFDDLLLNLHRAVQKDEGNSDLALKLRRLYKAALIDEFQDTDSLQYTIFNTLFGRGEHILFLIGDPKQAIYGFRGADIFAYLAAVQSVEKRYALRTNYRSQSDLIQGVNTIFSRNESPFLFDDIHYLPSLPSEINGKGSCMVKEEEKTPFKLCFLSRSESKPLSKETANNETASAVADEIVSLLTRSAKGEARIGDNPISPGDIAVLTRSHREAHMMKNSLDRLKVPSVLDSTGNIFLSDEVETMVLLLQAIHEPGNLAKLKATMSSEIFGFTAQELETLTGVETLLEECLIRFENYHRLWHERGFITMFRSFLMEEKVPQRLLSLPDGERRLTNITHIAELLHHEVITTGKGVTELLKWLSRQRSALITPEEHEIRLERDGNAVRIITIHKSKGLEFPIVFCPFAAAPATPNRYETVLSYNQEGKQHIALDPEHVEGAIDAFQREKLAENIRLLYVALTRAKYRCYLLVGNVNGYETSPLAYLLHRRGNEDFFTDTAERIKKMSDSEMLSDLQEVVGASGGTVELYDLFQSRTNTPFAENARTEELHCNSFSENIDASWKISSFSALLLNATRDFNLNDRDEEEVPEIHNEEENAPIERKNTIFAFPAGAKAGIFFHDLLENLDFTQSSKTEISALVTKKLEEHGFGVDWKEVVVENLYRILNTSLMEGKNNFTLSRISCSERLNELEFHFPISQKAATANLKVLCERLNSDAPEEEVRKQEFSSLPEAGFMKGFIDLVFCFEDRYYLVDWKSNLLGKDHNAYKQERLSQAMREKDYILQYHIYTAALHRYLSYRLPAYDYEKDFGGILYLFLRGMRPDLGSSHGVYFDKPPLSTIERLL